MAKGLSEHYSHGKNTTIKSMADGYDQIDTTPQDNLTSCYYNWKEIAGSITISHKEQRKNSGKHKMIDLLQSKVDEAILSFQEEIVGQLLTIATSSPASDLDPITLFIQKTPSDAATVRWNCAGTYAWWRNAIKAGSTATFAGILKEMTNLYNTCSKGAGAGRRDFPESDSLRSDLSRNCRSRISGQNKNLRHQSRRPWFWWSEIQGFHNAVGRVCA